MVFGEEIRKSLTDGLRISRIPEKTRKGFIELADTEFCSDYGLTLKYLFDLHNGLINTGVEHIEGALEVLNERVSALEQKYEEKGKKPKKRLDGNG